MKFLTLLLLLSALFCPSFALADAAELLRVRFYAVGKADAMLIETPDGLRVMIDTGLNKNGKELAKRFAQEGIDRIDLMILTHFDKDHIGGADVILENIPVRRVLMPDYLKDGKQFTQLEDGLRTSPDTVVTKLGTNESLVLSVGSAQLYVTAAHDTDYGPDEENDFSLAIRLLYGDTRFLFPGDAEDARQRELMQEGDIACDVLKVPHHGRIEDSSPAFLAACAPKIAFVTDSDEEPADPRLIRLLTEAGCRVFSARNGEICVASDGENVFVE